jgi:hypothetical protein
VAVPKCPVCESFQVVIVIGPSPSAWCDICGARWVQQGGEQRSIMREPIAFGQRMRRISLPARLAKFAPRAVVLAGSPSKLTS